MVPGSALSIMQVQLPREWILLGLRGQRLGTVASCGLDMQSGRVKYLVLATPWQQLKIAWQSVQVDTTRECFRLRSTRGFSESPPQEPSS